MDDLKVILFIMVTSIVSVAASLYMIRLNQNETILNMVAEGVSANEAAMAIRGDYSKKDIVIYTEARK